jgi:hypothetical protein
MTKLNTSIVLEYTYSHRTQGHVFIVSFPTTTGGENW